MGLSGRLAAFFQATPLTPLLALVAFLLGVFAVVVTPKEEEPQIDVTMATVRVPFPGASARDVESLVTLPAEQVLSRMPGVEHVLAVSQPGQALLTVQFQVGVARDAALVQLYDTVHRQPDWLRPELGVGTAVVRALGIDDVPVLGLTLSTADPERAAFELDRIATALSTELKRVPGTRDVVTLGGPGREIRVELDANRLRAVALTPLEVAAALRAANQAGPAGELVADNRLIRIEAGDFLRDARELKTLVVGVYDGRPVYLDSVARVVDGPSQPGRYVWFGAGAAGVKAGLKAGEQPAVTIAVSKKPGANAVAVTGRLLSRVEALKGVLIPAGVDVHVTRNYGDSAQAKASKLIQKLLFATLSVIALVWLSLGRREAIIVGAAVLLTLAVTLFASWAWGFTLNRVSLFALIFSIGILVDDAIVVVENIHRRRTLDPTLPLTTVIPQAVAEVGGPTILATFTVIAALLPMAFVSGLMGPYMSPIPINAALGMLLSLAIAFTVTPWLAARLLPAEVADAHHEATRSDRLLALVRRGMGRFLDADTGRRQRHRLYAGIALAIVLALSLAAVKLVVLKMLPFDNKSEFQVVVDLPLGTPVETTAAVLHELGAELATVPEVRHYQAYAGTSAPITFNGLVRQYDLRQAPEQGDLQVNLVDQHARDDQSHAIAQRLRPRLEAIARRWGAKLKLVEVPPGPPVLAPLVAEIYGPDEAGRATVARAVRQVFARTPAIVAIDDSTTDVAAQQRLVLDRNKARLLGVAPDQVVQTLQAGLGGWPVTPLFVDDSRREVPIVLTLPDTAKTELDTLLQLGVKAADGAVIPLGELVRRQPEAREPIRYRKDLLPVQYVVGDMAGATDSPLYGLFAMRAGLAQLKLPEGLTLTEHFVAAPDDPWRGYHLKWDGEWQVTYETFRDMGAAYGVGLILIYLLVVAQFRSYAVPLIIMAPIPLTVIGVMPGHALLGAHFTATSMIGMIALAGIIVRNSILLVDFIDQETAAGTALDEAVLRAVAARAKPIVLTALAAMLGAFFILDDPIFNGLAISLIFGIFVSTLLTLVLIPVGYYAYRRRG